MSNDQDQRVSDAPSGNWVYQLLPPSLWPYAQLARWDRPIGWWLLLWPCWWSLAMAAAIFNELADLWLMILFWLGAVVMRGAGCTYNDLVDRDIDAKVERTRSRPIPSGRVTARQAIMFLVAQLLVGAAILFSFNGFAIVVGLASLAIIAIYPFAKRITHWPQLVLGMAFSWGALLGWAAVYSDIAPPPIFLYAGSILWVIGYDTIYAHQDKEDDALVGVRSTALLFGERTKPALIILYTATLVLFGLAMASINLSWPAFAGLVLGAGHMLWQIWVLNINDPDDCLRLFKSNSQFGMIIFAGISASVFVG